MSELVMSSKKFELVSDFLPQGDQPQAIEEIRPEHTSRQQASDTAGCNGNRENVHSGTGDQRN